MSEENNTERRNFPKTISEIIPAHLIQIMHSVRELQLSAEDLVPQPVDMDNLEEAKDCLYIDQETGKQYKVAFSAINHLGWNPAELVEQYKIIEKATKEEGARLHELYPDFFLPNGGIDLLGVSKKYESVAKRKKELLIDGPDHILPGFNPNNWGTRVDRTYATAVKGGFKGTEEEWDALLKSIEEDIVGYMETIPPAARLDVDASGNYLSASATIETKLSEDEVNEMTEAFQTMATDLITDNLKSGELSPESWGQDLRFHGMSEVFPNRTHRELDPMFKRCVDAMVTFMDRLTNNQAGNDFSIYTYRGATKEGDEIVWVRYEFYAGYSQTFCCLATDFDTWVDVALNHPDMDWCTYPQQDNGMLQKGHKHNVSKAPIEYPLSWFERSYLYLKDDPYAGLYTGDFDQVHTLAETLRKRTGENVAEITKRALRLISSKEKKDHDLYLTFKGTGEGHLEFTVGLEKVKPYLGEGGQLSVGDNPVNIFEWKVDKPTLVLAKQIINYGKYVNRDIADLTKLVKDHPAVKKAWEREVRAILMGTTHFVKKIYGCQYKDVETEVHQVANDIVAALTKRGGNIGLDLNGWMVWEYFPSELDDTTHSKRPQRVMDPELDFVELILNRYTDSFVEVLYGFLLDLGNPYIKPYDYRVKADKADGYAIGSMRENK